MSLRTRLSSLALIGAACVAYGSLVPLRWRAIGWVEGLHRAAEIPVAPVWQVLNGDFFTNVLVFLPIGFFTAGALAPRSGSGPGGLRDSWRPLSVGAAVLMGSVVLSTLIELGQVYVRDRTPSWSDVYAQTLGGVSGAVLWLLVGAVAIDWIAGLRRVASREDRVLRLLGLYAVGWAIYGLLPTLFPHLAHPQLYLWTSGRHWSRLALLGPLAVAAVSTMPVGAAAALFCARLHWWAAFPLAAAGVGLLVVADSVRQVGIMPADGQLAAGLLGYSCGWMAASLVRSRSLVWHECTRWPLAVALTAWLGLVVLHYWAPFNFGVNSGELDQRVRVLYLRAPFHRYYWLPPLVALGEVTTLALLSLGTSIALGLMARGNRRMLSARTSVLVTTLVFAVVEWGQLYLPARRADPTDVLIACAGAFGGAAIVRALTASSQAEGMTS